MRHLLQKTQRIWRPSARILSDPQGLQVSSPQGFSDRGATSKARKSTAEAFLILHKVFGTHSLFLTIAKHRSTFDFLTIENICIFISYHCVRHTFFVSLIALHVRVPSPGGNYHHCLWGHLLSPREFKFSRPGTHAFV